MVFQSRKWSRAAGARALSLTRVLAMLFSAFTASGAWGAEYTGLIAELQPNHNTHNCFFFRLEGVIITPASPGNWFAIAYTSIGAKEAFGVLLAAKLSGTPVKVTTLASPQSVCNYAEATYVAI